MTTDAKGATSIVEEGLELVQALFIFVGMSERWVKMRKTQREQIRSAMPH
jgi:hypothetical protein